MKHLLFSLPLAIQTTVTISRRNRRQHLPLVDTRKTRVIKGTHSRDPPSSQRHSPVRVYSGGGPSGRQELRPTLGGVRGHGTAAILSPSGQGLTKTALRRVCSDLPPPQSSERNETLEAGQYASYANIGLGLADWKHRGSVHWDPRPQLPQEDRY